MRRDGCNWPMIMLIVSFCYLIICDAHVLIFLLKTLLQSYVLTEVELSVTVHSPTARSLEIKITWFLLLFTVCSIILQEFWRNSAIPSSAKNNAVFLGTRCRC
jgi:hypothetical protein